MLFLLYRFAKITNKYINDRNIVDDIYYMLAVITAVGIDGYFFARMFFKIKDLIN